ncbi:hypothetical protein GQR60_14570 [Labilibaculum sp. A4]|uniref:hypothetical protein n=1 Tax=Labilibaculum euxinus TaxID=2686357 RepID=UPI000F61E3F9|nr:hypothetical protein [Labilibaculum euxinus]MDQ1770224.1 hypothetical protein [Labilibaculum euxinus]MWN77561.1 hypothetical protein [Labilibaculum euxinus]
MKNFTLILLFLSLGLSSFFASCSKDDSDGLEITGVWKLVSKSTQWGVTSTVTEIMEFNADNTGFMTTQVSIGDMTTTSDAYDFTYKFDGSSLTINSADINRTTTAYVDGQILTIEAKVNGDTYKREYTRLTKQELAALEEEKRKEEEDQANIKKLIGSWFYTSVSGLSVYEEVLTFKEDMTGVEKVIGTYNDIVMEDEETDFEFEVSGDKLSITIDGETIVRKMEFSDKVLILIDEETNSYQDFAKVQ